MAASLQILVNLALLGFFPASAIAWGILIRRRIKRYKRLGIFGPLVPPVPRPNPFWTPLAFLVLMGCFLIVSPLLQLGFAALGVIEMPTRPPADAAATPQPATGFQDSAELALGTMVFVISCLLTCVYLYLLAPKRFGELGLRPTARGVRLGLIASLLTLPPLMLMMAGVSWLVPYEHKVLDVLADEPSLIKFGVLFIATAIITPIVEEFTIRVVLQGSLQGWADRGYRQPDGNAQPDEEDVAAESVRHTSDEAPVTDGDSPAQPTGVAWAYRASLDDSGRVAVPPETSAPESGSAKRADWPVLITSLLFAMLHFGQGLAPVPLFFLSLVLGYLYRQTGNITASVVVHMVLNSITMIVSFVAVAAGGE